MGATSLVVILHLAEINDVVMVFDVADMQDGSYSRGPVTIPVGEMSESNYYLTPTFKFEQVCLYFCFLRFLKFVFLREKKWLIVPSSCPVSGEGLP